MCGHHCPSMYMYMSTKYSLLTTYFWQGVDILSTYLHGSIRTLSGKYQLCIHVRMCISTSFFPGTSMASPHIVSVQLTYTRYFGYMYTAVWCQFEMHINCLTVTYIIIQAGVMAKILTTSDPTPSQMKDLLWKR